MTEEAKTAKFVARITALPEKEQAAFWRGIMAVVDAGYKTGSAPEDVAKYFVEFFTELKKHNHETKQTTPT
jgi:hypothetical protein